jgi:hypothetical protein
MAQPAVAGSLKLIIIQKKTNMKHFRIFSLLTFAIMGLFACQSSNNGAPTDEVKPQNDLSVALTEEQFKTGGIVIDSIRKRTFNEKVQVSGPGDGSSTKPAFRKLSARRLCVVHLSDAR